MAYKSKVWDGYQWQEIASSISNLPYAKGGGNDQIFFETDKTVTTSYTITTNKNAMTAGPISIANGVTVTIPDGTTWTVV
jgi:hypothetical protein